MNIIWVVIISVVSGFLGMLLMALVSVTNMKQMISRLHDLQQMNLQLGREKEELQKMMEAADQDGARQHERNEILWKVIEELDAEELAQARLKNPDA